MPEGNKPHLLASEHAGWFAGQSLKVTSLQGRFWGEARKVNGRLTKTVLVPGLPEPIAARRLEPLNMS